MGVSEKRVEEAIGKLTGAGACCDNCYPVVEAIGILQQSLGQPSEVKPAPEAKLCRWTRIDSEDDRYFSYKTECGITYHTVIEIKKFGRCYCGGKIEEVKG